MATSANVQGLTYVPDPAGFTPTSIAFFNATDPNVGTPTFYTDPDNIPGTTNPALAATVGTLYIGTDGSSWIWDGTQYVSQATANATEWTFAGSSTDAGSSKTASIARKGSISVSDIGAGSPSTFVASRRESNAITSAFQSVLARVTAAVNAVVPVEGLNVTLRLKGTLCNAATGVTSLLTPEAGHRISGNSIAGLFRANTVAGGRVTGTTFGVNAQCLAAGTVNLDSVALRAESGTTGTGTIGGSSYALYLLSSGNARVAGVSYGIFQTFTDPVNSTSPRNYLRGWTGINTNAPTANLTVNGTANKTGGGLWAVASDERIKRDVKPYKRGLKDLLKINPVTYRYRLDYVDSLIDPGASAADRVTNRVQGSRTHVGVIAQDIRNVLPNTVDVRQTAFLNDQLEFDGNELTYLLINAVKELTAEVEMLRAKVGR